MSIAPLRPPPGPSPTAAPPRVPPLEAGDRLSRPEFERRYAAMPRLKKAELLEGTVYMPSPVSFGRHARPHALLSWLCGHYALTSPGVEVADNTTLRLDLANEPQPDIAMFRSPESGGQARVDEDDFLAGAPELVIEIASSSRSYDLHVKREVYRRHGVREYVVFRVDDGEVDWFLLEDGEFVAQAPDETGVLSSRVFPGFRLHVPALLAADRALLARTLDGDD
jgi:Uma2 family endonuclease